MYLRSFSTLELDRPVPVQVLYAYEYHVGLLVLHFVQSFGICEYSVSIFSI